ncbi:MAG: thioredoxin domain-containing protein [Candidatus Omnitrophica bacterium]|nr:thioredoxin domain-containing protein [Candidatus Omnitrophota bacterium]MCB9719951.1 thioredoxin domain-containing protein [Candidatus Omnitrophota bacterium]
MAIERRTPSLLWVLIILLTGICGLLYVQQRALDKRVMLLQEQSVRLSTAILNSQNNNADNKTVKAIDQRLDYTEKKIAKLDTIFGPGGIDAVKAPVRPDPVDFDTVYDIPVAHSPVIGDREAPVTIVMFVDFECPFCARYYTPLPELVQKLPGRVNYVIKNFPLTFQKQAVPAAKAALAAAEQGKYPQMVQALFDNRKGLSEQKYVDLAGEIGLDVERFKSDLRENDAKYDGYIQNDIRLGKKLDVRGTPSFYINGRVARSRDFQGFVEEIENITAQ